MSGHFGAFSFVDRISALDPGVGIHGHYFIPPAVDSFPLSLVAEAVGQLAACAAIAAVDFSYRPVAGVAGAVELLADVRPGQVLDLAAELESVDTETVGYHGTASADDVTVLRLKDCVGPMMPMGDFDDPDAWRERLAMLSGTGATPGGFAGLPLLELQHSEGEPGRSARAILRIPSGDAPLFADHFPRRPVFPGTLLMHAKLQTAARLAATLPADSGASWIPRLVSNVKLRTFIQPGEILRLEANRTTHSATALSVAVESRTDQRLIGTADIEFAAEVKR